MYKAENGLYNIFTRPRGVIDGAGESFKCKLRLDTSNDYIIAALMFHGLHTLDDGGFGIGNVLITFDLNCGQRGGREDTKTGDIGEEGPSP